MTVQQVRVDFNTHYSGRGLNQFQRDLGTLTGQVQRVSASAAQSFTAFGRFAQAAGTALLVGVGAALAVGIKASIDFESAFAGVRKTVDGSETTFQQLARGIRDLSTEIPVAATELARIGELGGQLGVGAGDLEDFISVVAKLGASTNLATDDAASGVARFTNVMQTSQGEFENVASSLVDLGNNFATTESEILTFGTRLAGIGSTIGLTEGDVLGLAAAFTALGEPAGRGATALQRTFIAMLEAIQGGTSELTLFAETAGLSVQAFVDLFNTDPAEAFIAFEQGLNRVNQEGGATTQILDDLGLGTQRTIGLLLKGAAGWHTLSDAVDQGNESYDENTALTEEAEKRFGTLASQLTILGNQFTDLRIEIGDKATPAVKEVVGFFGGLFDVVSENLGVLQGMAVLVGVLAGARGIVKLGQGLGNLMTSFSLTARAGTKLIDKMGGLSAGARFLGGVLGIVAVGLAGVATVMAINRQRANAYQDAIENLVDTLEDLEKGAATAKDAYEAFNVVLQQPTGLFDVTIDLDEFREFLANEAGISARDLVDLAINDVAEFDRVTDEITKKFQERAETIRSESAIVVGEGGILGPVFAKELDENNQALSSWLRILTEVKAATAGIRAEEQLRRKEAALERSTVPMIMGGFGPNPFQIDPQTDQEIDDFVRGIIDPEGYADALDDILAESTEFGTEFLEGWNTVVGNFEDLLFNWSSAWDGYENVAAISTTKLRASLTNWVEDAARLTSARLFVLEQYGQDELAFFDQLPEDLQRGLAASFTKGEGLFSTQFGLLLDTDQELIGLMIQNLIASAPAEAAKALPAWEAFFDNELAPTLADGAAEGTAAWNEALTSGLLNFIDSIAAQDPIMAAALQDLLEKGGAGAVENLHPDFIPGVIDIITSDLTTEEKIQAFRNMGFSWARSTALGFSSLIDLLGAIGRKSADESRAEFERAMGIHSASRVAIDWGRQIGRGMGIGLNTNMPMISQYVPNNPVVNVQAPSSPASGPHIEINHPHHPTNDILADLQRATTLVGITRAAEVVPGNS